VQSCSYNWRLAGERRGLAGGAGKKAAKNQGYNPATLVFTRVGSGQQARRIGWHVRSVDFSDAAHVSSSDTKNSAV